jgi:hypothetical protein
MYSIVQRCVLPPLKQEGRQQLPPQAHLLSIADIFEAVPDSRGRYGWRYDVPFRLACLIAVTLSNGDDSEAVSQWCCDHQEVLRTCFGPRLFLMPSGSLYRAKKPMRSRSPRACFPRDLWLIGCVLPMLPYSNDLHAGDSRAESWYGSHREGESTDLLVATSNHSQTLYVQT